VVAGKLAKHWSPAQISRWLRRRYRRRPGWHVCIETPYEAESRGRLCQSARLCITRQGSGKVG
jgi:hypothetical protein